MSKKVRDPGLQQIDARCQFIVDAKALRLREAGVDAETFTREMADVERVAANIREKLRADYVAWVGRPAS